jgi:hypothetical protein
MVERGVGRVGVLALAVAVAAGAQAPAAVKTARAAKGPMCSRATLEGKVKAGESFTKIFAGRPGSGLEVMLEALPSGWIVRVLPAGVPRGAHDYAELATPPYRSVSPLLISTDFSFRAQDALAWNPREFRYTENAAVFGRLAALYPKVMADDGKAMADVAVLVSSQPEGELQILSGTLVPGTADQWRMAAAVASHLAETPHQVAEGEKPTPLGKLVELEFRLRINLEPGVKAAAGVKVDQIPCAARPTT